MESRTRAVVMLCGLAVVVIAAGLSAPWGAGMLDLTVYRLGAHTLISGGNVYAMREPTSGLAFTYPIFGAIRGLRPFRV